MSNLPVIEVFYSNKLKNWDDVIDTELKKRGLSDNQCVVLAYPSTSATGPVQMALFST